ncbi:MAG: hypothetical protein J5666_02120, partial [Bacilli bacterium]|nr:hypothetical protein [Bacilli bacterium]
KATIDGLVGYTLYGGVSFTYRDDVDITWSSSNEAIIANDLTYNAPDSDTEVTLTATITKGEVTDTATVTFLCKGIVSIASIKASEDLSQKFVIKGNVLAVSQISFIVQDGSGYIYVYYGSNFEQDLEIGDEVVVRGYVSIYNELYEFSSEVGYTKTGESITITNTPDELDGEAFDLLGNTTGFRYIKITGDYYYDGRYHTFYPVGSESCVANLVRPLVDGLDEVNGERLIITGYYCFAEGQDPRYLNIVVTGFEVYEWTDEELVNDAVRSINDIQNYPLVAGIYFTFGDRYTVTWTSSHENILSSSFEYHVPEVDTLVTMTATITVGEVTDTASCTFLCKAPSTIASVIASESQDERMLVKGTVVAVSATCFLVEDDTAKILVYYGDKFAQDLEVGDEVYVRGYLTTYNGTLQFGANVGYEKTGEKNDVEYPEATLLTGGDFDSLLDTTAIAYVKVSGTLQVSGNYYNFVVDGASYRGSIVNPTDKLLRFVDGKEIELTGYYLYTTGSKERYISFIATNIDYEEVEVSYDYYITGTEIAYWQVNHDYKLQEMAVDSLVNHEFTNNYIKDELLAIATELGDKDVETVYVFEFEIAGENAEWSTGALIEGDYAEMNGSYAFKVVYAMEHESYGIYEDTWIPSPESEKAESLTPNTLFMPNNHQEQDDEFGFNWNSNPVITSGTGKYLLVFAKYNPELSDAGASYGFAVVKAITE